MSPCPPATLTNDMQEGCGTPGSCTAYLDSLSPFTTANSIQGLMPAAGFGRFGQGCNPDGRYPYGTCSLKQVADVVNPPAWGVAADAEGWIGGVTPKAPSSIRGCPVGMSEATCRTCAVTRSPELCYRCMAGTVAYQAGAAKCVPCANGGVC
jgi:hypothetical protein